MEKKVICDHCGFPFGRKDHLLDHIRRLHSSETEIKKFVCPLDGCGVLSLYKSNWTVHLKKIHNKSLEEINILKQNIETKYVKNESK